MPAKLRLPNVTLITVTSVEIEQTNAALLHCCRTVDFGAVKMLCSSPPKICDPRVQYIPIMPIDITGYSRFMIERLNDFVQTDYCLVIQADGFILNAEHWKKRFFDYDYIGAPWQKQVAVNSKEHPVFRFDKNLVGNGGFSLRSKKLLQLTSRLNYDRLDFLPKAEDVIICHHLYEEMLSEGVKFAPPKLAAFFSIESPQTGYGDSPFFGFHGRHWLPAVYQAFPWLRV